MTQYNGIEVSALALGTALEGRKIEAIKAELRTRNANEVVKA